MPTSPTILVVDDSVTQLAVLQDALEGRGFHVETAQDGMEAISKVYQSPPSLILSDVLMPELNGYYLCRLLKNDPVTAHIPIILLTNLKERHDRFWGENAGADRYLEKGADLEPILREVSALLASTSPQGRKEQTVPFQALDSADIQTRITGLLDRLLYESTISNEVLKLTGLAHDAEVLAREFLKFLSVISRFSVGALLLKNGCDKYILCLQVAESVPDSFLARAREDVLSRAGLESLNPAQLHTLFFLDETARCPDAEAGFHVLLSLPIRDDELRASVTLFDVKKRQISAGTRHALNVVADRFLIVARYLQKFREIEEVKADFVSMLVHDMRSPLTSIRGFTDVLADEILGSVSDEQRGALKNIRGGCERLLHLIEDIMDLSKLEAGKMQLDLGPLQLLPLTELAVADLAPQVREKGLDICIDIPEKNPSVLADAKQLSRVLNNLLSNAVKFTPAGGSIVIKAEVPAVHNTSQVGICARVSVSDNGSGIPPEQQAKLFARYQQLSSPSMFRKGTGLGLAICKEIITLHGGEIWVESPVAEDKGSRFVFTLPLATP